MSPEDPDLPAPALAPAAESEGGSLGRLAALVVVLALGVGLRWLHAEDMSRGGVLEWEADGFVTAWEGRRWGDWNRLRPLGTSLVLSRLAEVLDLPSVRDIRLACVGLSLLGFLAAWELARGLSRRSRLPRRSLSRAGVWLALVWAVHPTLIRSAVTPSPELLTGPTLCLLLSALVARRDRAGPVTWALVAAAVALAVTAGGVTVAAAFTVGVLTYLIPIPRFVRTMSVLGLVLVAAGTLFAVQSDRVHTERPWLPDTAGVHSLAALIDEPPPHPNDLPSHADRRELLMARTVWRALPHRTPFELLSAFVSRVREDVLGPARFEPFTRSPHLPALVGDVPTRVVVGWSDLFLRGGLLLFACAVIGLLGAGEFPSRLPRAGVVVGLAVWALLSCVGAVGPLVSAPIDLVLLGAAAAGVAGADPRRAWTRRLAFSVGGVLLCTFSYTAGWGDAPLSPWIETAGQRQTEGDMLVGLLDTPDPGDATREMRIANLLMRPHAPLLRLPEAAMTHAQQAVQLMPLNDDALELRVRALVESADYRGAARDAEVLLGATQPNTTERRRADLLLEWVRQEQRLSEGLAPGR